MLVEGCRLCTMSKSRNLGGTLPHSISSSAEAADGSLSGFLSSLLTGEARTSPLGPVAESLLLAATGLCLRAAAAQRDTARRSPFDETLEKYRALLAAGGNPERQPHNLAIKTLDVLNDGQPNADMAANLTERTTRDRWSRLVAAWFALSGAMNPEANVRRVLHGLGLAVRSATVVSDGPSLLLLDCRCTGSNAGPPELDASFLQPPEQVPLRVLVALANDETSPESRPPCDLLLSVPSLGATAHALGGPKVVDSGLIWWALRRAIPPSSRK